MARKKKEEEVLDITWNIICMVFAVMSRFFRLDTRVKEASDGPRKKRQLFS